MDFIEQLFGVGLDGGPELKAWFVLVLIGLVVCWALWRHRRVPDDDRHLPARPRKGKDNDLDLLRHP